jgi:hypothetical protein
MLIVVLLCIVALLALAVAGALFARAAVGTPLIYGGSLAVSAIGFVAALIGLADGPFTLALPKPSRSACCRSIRRSSRA